MNECVYIYSQLLSAKAMVYLLNASSRDYLRLLSTDNRDHDTTMDESGEEKTHSHDAQASAAAVASIHRVSSNKKLEAVRLATLIQASI